MRSSVASQAHVYRDHTGVRVRAHTQHQRVGTLTRSLNTRGPGH